MYQFICYPYCSTCKKAKKWLDDHNIEYVERDISQANPNMDELQIWIPKSHLPVRKFFNTSGKLYRELKLSERLPKMSEIEQYLILSTNGMLVKRPLLIGEEKVLVGFKEAEWKEQLENKESK